MHCEVCHARYFVGFPSVSEAAQVKCDGLIQQLKPGSLLVAHPNKQTSSGGAWSRTVILLVDRRYKDEIDTHSSSFRLLDHQGGSSILIGYVLTGGEWNPPQQGQSRLPLHTLGVREHRLPGGPVKAWKAVVTNVANVRGARPIPLLGEPNRGMPASSAPPNGALSGCNSLYAASSSGSASTSGGAHPHPHLFFVTDAASAAMVSTVANRMHSPNNPALVLHCEGAAVWTDEQIVRETIAGSWGVLPAKAAHAWRVSEPSRDGRGMWAELMASGQVVFATDLIAQADAKAAAEAAAAMPQEVRVAREQRRQQLLERERRLLHELSSAGQDAQYGPSRKIGACALPLQLGSDGFGSVLEEEARALLAAMGPSSRFVLLGECTHGTAQFYDVRAALSRVLIEHHGFQAVVVEGDWPDAQRVNRYVSGRSLKDRNAGEALSDFGRRFPGWMWRNTSTANFIEWLRAHNDRAAEQGSASLPVGFYGMDLYSLHHSMSKVIEYLQGVDPPFAREAMEAYSVLEPYRRDPSAYGRAMAQGQLRAGNRFLSGVDVQRKLEGVLTQLQRRNEGKYEYELRYTAEERLDAEINAEVVVNAESYFRENWHALGHMNTWNARDQHMVQVIMRLDIELKAMLNPHAPSQDSKIIVWAHNSHVGDVRATELHSAHGARGSASDLQLAAIRGAAQVGPKWSLGHLMRETFGRDSVYSVGFSTYDGSVTAAAKWGDVAQCFSLNPAIPGSVGETMHQAMPHMRMVHEASAARGFALLFSDRGAQPATPPRAAGAKVAPSDAASQMQQHQESVWRRGDPATAAEEAAAKAAEVEALLATLGGAQLRQARGHALKSSLYPMRPFRAVGTQYKKDDEMRAHYVNTTLPELVDALIHIDSTDAVTPLDVNPEWRQGHEGVAQARRQGQARAHGFATFEQMQQAAQGVGRAPPPRGV